jgi:hypothetical protein
MYFWFLINICVMYKEVVIPSIQNPVYQFPKEAYGKKVIVMFENEEKETVKSSKDVLKESDSNSAEFTLKKEDANDNRSFAEKHNEAVEFFKKHSIAYNNSEKWNREDLYDE